MIDIDVKTLKKSFEVGHDVLSDLSFEINAGEHVGILGANGCGKTTLFNVVSGLVRPTAGVVRFRGTPIGGLPSFRIARLGIARTFQLVRILPALTVAQNVLVGLYFGGRNGGVWASPDEGASWQEIHKDLPDVLVLRAARI